MEAGSVFADQIALPDGLSIRLSAGLALLLEAHNYCAECQAEPWAFAVEIDRLLAAGLSHNDLRWLEGKGYVCHAVETTRARSRQRTFRQAAQFALVPNTCFVLSPVGVAAVQCLLCSNPVPTTCCVPCWDGGRRELRWGPELVKRYRLPAPNQELILMAFEEEGWPAYIYDPLPTRDGQDPKQRLHDTIKGLNQHQVHIRLRFRGDGSGRKVCWERRVG